ncbi:unnamed protein product [Chironomus riparius]|uniref:Uncharacterized protein n=1 Tax=Chironomus riparius TaxID=315576 RepID=A0A9N9SBA1_9DIPT|nr:unnamed protein product [Chironomus riparius]
MGSFQSKSNNFQSKYQPIIDLIESEHDLHVYHKLMKINFISKEQLDEVGIILYEKAVFNPNLSLKCAQFVKQLGPETVFENGEKIIFHSNFDRYLMNLINSIIENYDDSKMTDCAVELGKNIATFIGHLFDVEFLDLKFLIEIVKAAKRKETKNNEFFIKTIWNVTDKKLKDIHGITYESFNDIITGGFELNLKNTKLDPDYNSADRFCSYLKKILFAEHYKFYEHFEDFANMREDTLKTTMTTFLENGVENSELTKIFRDLAIEIYNIRPNETKTNLVNFFNEHIDLYQYYMSIEIDEGMTNINNLGILIVDFYIIGLINEDIIEKFLNTIEWSRMSIDKFNNFLIEVLTKYRGPFMRSYFEHSKKSMTNLKARKILIPVLEELIRCRELQMERTLMHSNGCARTVANLPDFYIYALKCQSYKEAFDTKNPKIQPAFICMNRPSCHFASLRGIEILKRHIGNKFFTPERIEICAKMTKTFAKFQINSNIGNMLHWEMKTYMPYHNGNTKPTRKFKNFSSLLAAFYNEKFINCNLVISWLSKQSKESDGYHIKEIYKEFYQTVSMKLEKDNQYAWQLYSNELALSEDKQKNFDSFEIFKEICSSFNYEVNNIDLMKLKMITIPNEKSAMKLASKHLLNMYSTQTISKSALVEIISFLLTPEIDNNLLQSVFLDVLWTTLGNKCAVCEVIGEPFDIAKSVIDLIETLCVKAFITQQGLATLLHVIAEVSDLNPYPIPSLMNYFIQKLCQFFVGSKALATEVERTIIDVKGRIRESLKVKYINSKLINEIVADLENILEKSRQKSEQDKGEKSVEIYQDSIKSNSPDSSSSSPAHELEKNDEVKNRTDQNDSKDLTDSIDENENVQNSTNSTDPSMSETPTNSSEPSASTAMIEEKTALQKEPETQNNLTDPQSTSTQSKITQEDIKDYQDYCNYFDNIEPKTSDDDKFFFDSVLISTIRITEKEQVINLVKKFIKRVQAGQSTIIFFIQNVQKIGNAIQNIFKLQKQKVSFQKLLIDEIFLKFENQERLLEFMCELYNNSFVNKTAMIAFVDKFKSQSPENIILMHKFVKTCAIRLSSQGDKEQLMQIRTIARTVKNLPNYDEDLKYQAQDLANSINSLIQLLDNAQNKPQILTESPEKLIEDLMKNVLKHPQIYVKTACRLDGKMKDLLIHNIEKIIKEVPKFVIKPDEFMNLLEFIAELYNLDFLKHEFLSWTIEIFLQSSTNEICSQSIEFLFMKCGQKMENENKHKLDIYMKYFDAVLAQDIKNIQSECFKRIQKLKNRKWKILNIPENFYEDFLMLFSMNDANVVELLDIFKVDEEEIDKFIQILWKIILKDQPHPTYSILCLEISKSCKNFGAKLTAFLTARCITFIGLNSDMFNENVKERLGKVMTFVADIYNNNLVSDQVLEAFLDSKLTSKLPSEFVTRIFSILSKCQRLNESRNVRLKTLVKDFDNIYHQGVSAQMESIINGLKSIETNIN